MLTAYRLNPDRTLNEVAMGTSVPALLRQLTREAVPTGRVWIEDSRMTAQTLVTMDIGAAFTPGTPSGRHGHPIELLNIASDPDALRREATDLQALALKLRVQANRIDKMRELGNVEPETEKGHEN